MSLRDDVISKVMTSFSDSTLPLVLEACERMHAHLTAAVVSNDVMFQNKVRQLGKKRGRGTQQAAELRVCERE